MTGENDTTGKNEEIHINLIDSFVFDVEIPKTDPTPNIENDEESIKTFIEDEFNSIDAENPINEVFENIDQVVLGICARFNKLTDFYDHIKTTCINCIEQCIQSIIGDKNISATFAVVAFVSSLYHFKNNENWMKTWEYSFKKYKKWKNPNVPIIKRLKKMCGKRIFNLISNHLPQHLMKSIYEGCDINVVDDKKQSPLHYAVILNNKKLVRILCAFGADFYALDIYNCRPVDYAQSLEMRKIINDAIVRRYRRENQLPLGNYVGQFAEIKGIGDVTKLGVQSSTSVYR